MSIPQNHIEEEEYDEEEDETTIEEQLYQNICQEIISVILQSAVKDALSDKQNPQKYFNQVQRKHPDIESKLEECFKDLQTFIESNSKVFKKAIAISYSKTISLIQSSC